MAQPDPEAPVEAVEAFGLPAHLSADLRRLERLPAPRAIQRVENWREVVADAMRLARGGWAASALALGWTAADLFGVGSRDSWDCEGLAVWLRGRSLLLIDEHRAVAEGGAGREAFVRGGMGHGTHPTVTPIMLWEFGR
ncbi:hypothetical protein [Sphingomonas aurea]|nr:hypothetical protein [Sphingomonas sp. KR1UV-12]